MQLLHLLDTGQNVFAVIKIYLRALECYIGRQPSEWNDTKQSGWELPASLEQNYHEHDAISVLLMSNIPSQSNLGSWRNMHFVIAKLFSFIFFSLDSAGNIGNLSHWHFLHWFLHHQISPKFMDRATKKEFCVA